MHGVDADPGSICRPPIRFVVAQGFASRLIHAFERKLEHGSAVVGQCLRDQWA